MIDDQDELETPTPPKGTERNKDTATDTPARKMGFILDEPDEEKVAQRVIEMRESQESTMSRNRAVWKRSRWWREGKRFIRLDKKENMQSWEAKMPVGMGSAPPVPNKTDRLCRRLVNVIMVDPPYPECEPGDNSNEAKDAAEFATRYLSIKGSPSDLNMELVCRSALDKAMTYASSFAWVTMDPGGAGHRPRKLLAHPLATSKEDALTDPETGAPAGEELLKERYLTPEDTLSDDPAEADYQWLPSPKIRLLTGHNVQFLPETARGMRDAIGVLITDTTTLGDLKAQFPDAVEGLNEEELNALCGWRPDRFSEILAPYAPIPDDQKDEDGKWRDSQTVVVMTVYYESCPEYPMGAYAVIGGNKLILHRETWSAPLPQTPNADGTERPDKDVPLELPLAQCRCLDDNTFDNPYGIGLAEHLGPADEIRASSLGYQMEYMFRFGNPQVYLPMGSIVQPNQLLGRRDGTAIMVNPNGNPFYEPVPPLPSIVTELRREMSEDMDDESGLQQSAQGVEDPSVQSGVHARTIVQEALKAVSNVKGNLGFFYIDLNRILIEQSKAFCEVPQLISYVGEDGAYKEKEWSRLSFRNTKNVTIARGSFTMHTLIAKQEMANEMKDREAIDMDEYIELISGGVSPILGIQDNPHLMRIRRQLEVWQDGPPEGYVEAAQAVAMATQQAQAIEQQNAQASEYAAQTGSQPMLQPPVQVPPMPPGPFEPRIPVDYEPMPAKVRHRQLARQMAASKFGTFAPEWQQALLAEYAEMKNAAGIMTVPEQQQIQQQQQQQQAQAAQAGAQAEQEQAFASQQADAEKANADREAQASVVPPAPPVVNVYVPDTNTAKRIVHERNERGEVIGSQVVPIQ